MLKKYRAYITTIIVTVILMSASGAISQSIKFNSLKPIAGTQLTDEQQGVLAVRAAKASVVNIIGVEKQATTTSLSSGLSIAPDISSPEEILGTGFILEATGLIVSNNHVVENSNMDYTVVLSDGAEYPAKILNLDKFDDIALLQISASNLTPANLGDSDSLETGQSVFAIGNSLGKYQYTVTRGVVSGLGRSIDLGQGDPRLHNLIQTDAAINPGNSGGPLINLAGQVVGMNTLIDNEGSGLGFAVSVNTIKDAVQQLKTFGKVSRPFLGVQFTSIDPSVQISQNLSVSSGGLIINVLAGTPAAQAGLLKGDIIVGINNFNVNQNQDLDSLIGKFQAGNQITLKILRNGQNLDVPLVLGQLR